MEGARVMTRVFEDLVAKFDDKMVMEVLVRRWSDGDVVACFRDELDNVVEEEDGGWICFLGGNNSSGTKKYQGPNSSDGDNTGDGVKITGEVIGSGGGIGHGDEGGGESWRSLRCLFSLYMAVFGQPTSVLVVKSSQEERNVRKSNIGDSDNTGDGGKIVGGAIRACGGIGNIGSGRRNLIDGKSISSEMRSYGSTMLSTRKVKTSISNESNSLITQPEVIALAVEEMGEVRVMTKGFGDLVAKLGDKVVMEVLVRCWSDGDVVVRSW
ncbi:hypothetical protein Tco_0693816 [Tanacetum coccineum]